MSKFANEDWRFLVDQLLIVCMQLYDKELTYEEMGQTLLCPNRYSKSFQSCKHLIVCKKLMLALILAFFVLVFLEAAT